jgi:hypothetical protein
MGGRAGCAAWQGLVLETGSHLASRFQGEGRRRRAREQRCVAGMPQRYAAGAAASPVTARRAVRDRPTQSRPAAAAVAAGIIV